MTAPAKAGKLSARHYLISVGISSVLTVLALVVGFKFPKYESLGLLVEPGLIAALFLVPDVHSGRHMWAYLVVTGILNVVLYSMAIQFVMKAGSLLRRKALRREA